MAEGLDPGKSKSKAGRTPETFLDPVEGYFHNKFGPDVNSDPLSSDLQLEEPLRLPPQHLVCKALEDLSQHDEPT